MIGSSLAFQIWAKVTGARARSRPAPTRCTRPRASRGAVERARRSAPPVVPSQRPHAAAAAGPHARPDRRPRRPAPGAQPRRVPPGRAVGRGALEVPAGGHRRRLEGFLFPDTYFIGEDEDEARSCPTIVARVRRDRRQGRASRTGRDQRAHAVPDGRRRVADPGRGQLAEDAPLISAVIRNRLRDGHAAADRRDALLREGRLPAGADQRRQADRLAVQHLQGRRAAAHADLTVTEARCSAALHPADVPYLYYVIGDGTGSTRSRPRSQEHEAQRRSEARGESGLL